MTFVHNADLEDVIKFQGELSYEYNDEVQQEADLSVNLSQTGSIDKTVLEAAACGTLVLTSNEAFLEPLSKISPLFIFERDNPNDLAEKIKKIKSLSEDERLSLGKKLRGWVEKEHNLANFAKRIIEEFKMGERSR